MIRSWMLQLVAAVGTFGIAAATWFGTRPATSPAPPEVPQSHRANWTFGADGSTTLPDGMTIETTAGVITGVATSQAVPNPERWNDLLGTRYVIGDLDATSVTRQLWRFVKLEMRKKDNSKVELDLARPLWWMAMQDAKVGATIHIDLSEMGIVGDAIVVSIRPCTEDSRENKKGQQIVTGKFTHHNAVVLDLQFEGLKKPLGVTANHPIYSVDRQSWVAAGKLNNGEHVRTIHGSTKLLTVHTRPSRETVYNLEVHRSHTFHVTDLGILVHNSCLADNLRKAGRYGDRGTDAHHIVAHTHRGAAPAQAILRKHGIDINSHFNGVWLPRNSSASRARGALHRERGSALTRKSYLDEVNQRVIAADAGGRAAVLRELQKIRFDLLNGTFPGVRLRS